MRYAICRLVCHCALPLWGEPHVELNANQLGKQSLELVACASGCLYDKDDVAND